MISSHGYQNLLLQTKITTSTIGGRHRNDAALFTTVMSEMCVSFDGYAEFNIMP